jgi:hypothetical protein
MECLYVNFVGLHVSVIHMTIIRSVNALVMVNGFGLTSKKFNTFHTVVL